MAVTTRARRRLRVLLAPLAATAAATALLLAGTTAPAQADDGYRYWGYFHVQDGKFGFADTGPSGFTPEDGSTEAYRFGTSTAAQGVEPRADLTALDFETVCAETDAVDGKKRVAVLIDYGSKADAATGAELPGPRAACAQVAADANGQQVLTAVAQVRTEKGLVCALDGYPSTGCGEQVKDATVPADEATVDFALPSDSTDAETAPAAAEDDSSGTNPGLLVAGAVVVLVLGGGAFALTRRRSS